MAGVTVDFNANLARFDNALNHADARLDSFGDAASRISGGITHAFAALGVGISVAGIAGVIKHTIDAADNLNDLSLKTGIAVDRLAGLSLASEQSGANLEGTAKAINKLSKEMGNNSAELARLGINADDPLQAFAQLADVFNAIDDPQQRAALGAKILGKSWEDAAPILSLGGDQLLKIVDKGAKASGITRELAEAADEFNDKMTDLTKGFQGLVVKGVAPLVPILNDLYEFFSEHEDSTKGIEQDAVSLEKTYKILAATTATTAISFEVLGLGVGALAAKLNALAHLDFKGMHAIEDAFKEDIDKAELRLSDLFTKLDIGGLGKHEIEFNATTKDQGGNAQKAITGKVQQYLDGADQAGEKVSSSLKKLDNELARHLKGVERNIDEESSLYQFRNKQVEVALDLGLITQEDYFAKKQALQKDQLAETEALLDQEINALKQFQSQATNEAARTDAQDKINELIRQKTKLERDGQIATLENAAAAQQALGDYGDSLVNINDLLLGVASNIIGMSKAQAELNFKKPGDQVTQQDLVNPNTIFQNAAGNSFSDQPIEELDKVRDKINEIKQEAAASGSGILLDVQVDKGSAVANLDETVSLLQEKLKNIELPAGVLMNKAGNFFTDNPLLLKTEVNQQDVINSIIKARDGAQAAVTPIMIPVIYQAQNSPNAPAPQGGPAFDLAQTALAQGGR